MASQSHSNLEHVRWVPRKDRQRVLTMPQQLVQTLGYKVEVKIAFGLKAENGVVTQVVPAASFKSGWFGGWNWTFKIEVIQGVPLVRIFDLNGKFVYEGPLRRFNILRCPITEKQIAPSAAFKDDQYQYQNYTIVPEFMLSEPLFEPDAEPWCVVAVVEHDVEPSAFLWRTELA
jgi:hypothetical protein